MGPIGSVCSTSVPSPFWKRTRAVAARPVAFSKAMRVSKKPLVAPSAKYRVNSPTCATKNGAILSSCRFGKACVAGSNTKLPRVGVMV